MRRRTKHDLPPELAELIEKTWPDGRVELSIDPDESWFSDVCPKLKQSLARITGARLDYERKPAGEPVWEEGSDPDQDPPDWEEAAGSYYLFFVHSTDEHFRYTTETEPVADADDEHTDLVPAEMIPGEGWIGWAVAVSLLAPVALLRPATNEWFEDGTRFEPDLDSCILSAEGEILNPEEHYREVTGGDWKLMERLRGRIGQALEAEGIRLLSPTELRKPVPWLSAAGEVLIDHTHPVTLEGAFFFRQI